MTNSKKTKTVSYFDPARGVQVSKTIEVPDPLAVRTLPDGATVEEIGSMEELKARWGQSLIADLSTPLNQHGREILRGEVLQAVLDENERGAIIALCQTHHFNDDRLLKLVGRLVAEVERQRQKREMNVNKRANLLHEKDMWLEKEQRLKDENKALLKDVEKVMRERDQALKSAGYNQKNRDNTKLRSQVTSLQAALATACAGQSAAEQERDLLQRDAARNVEIALTEYESAVVGKLGSVAAEHKVAMDENRSLKTTVEGLKVALAAKNQEAKVPKESMMNPDEQNTNETENADVLKAGDEVFCKVSGEGPFVLLTQVEEAQIEYANPISNKRNSFAVGKLPIHNAWLVRCKDATMRTLPAPVLTKVRPKSSFSFSGVKALVTSDVTSKLFQAAIWAAMLTLLYMQNG